MKKILSVIISLVFVFLSCNLAFSAHALDTSPLDLSNYTMDDIASMSSDEYRQLLADFERTYDPLSTYNTTPIMENYTSGNTVSPQWSSGTIKDDIYTESGSHELITAQSCVILDNDLGFFGNNAIENIVISLTISLASLKPDQKGWHNGYAWHFYNPETGASYTGYGPSARVKANEHFLTAVDEYKAGDQAAAWENLGCALHYLQDAGQPQHASNFTNMTAPIGVHGQFEAFADSNMENYMSGITSVYTHGFYTTKNFTYTLHTPFYYVHECATIAHSYSVYTNTTNTIYWDTTANRMSKNAAAFSALFLYIFSRFAEIPLK